MKQISLYGKKDGQYRGLAVSYKFDHHRTIQFWIQKAICDSFGLHRFIKISKKAKENYKKYIISEKGSTIAEFSMENYK